MKSRVLSLRTLCGVIVGLALLGVVAVVIRAVLFVGPYRPAVPLLASKFVDLHVHTAGIGAGESGCFVSPKLQQSYKFGIYLGAFGTTREEVARLGDASIIRRISEQLSVSAHVGAAVVLALDGVVNETGDLDRDQTQVFVPNEFVARETARYTNLLFGASINPYRRDALARLDWAATHGAVLVKWIPNTMKIDPADERLIPFYERLKALGLPLLSHAGEERSFTHAEDAFGDPNRLRLPLRLGVTVIAAHVASTGENDGEPNFERLARLMGEFPNLFTEISALTQANRLGSLRAALRRPEFAGRLCYGSDFPLINTPIVSPWFFPLNLTQAQMRSLAGLENPWDRDVALKQALGVPPEVFIRTEALLRAGQAAARANVGQTGR